MQSEPQKRNATLTKGGASALAKAPVVPKEDSDSLKLNSRAAERLQGDYRRKQSKKRETFMKENEEAVLEATTMLQAALRGHIARQRISKQLQKQDWVQVGDDVAEESRPPGVSRLGASKRSATMTSSRGKRVDGGDSPSKPKGSRRAAKDKAADASWQMSDDEPSKLALDAPSSPEPEAAPEVSALCR